MSRPAVVHKANIFQTLVAAASIPMATLVALWVVAGRLPVRPATADEVVAEARESLARLRTQPEFLTPGLLHTGRGKGELALTVRSLTQAVWPAR